MGLPTEADIGGMAEGCECCNYPGEDMRLLKELIDRWAPYIHALGVEPDVPRALGIGARKEWLRYKGVNNGKLDA